MKMTKKEKMTDSDFIGEDFTDEYGLKKYFTRVHSDISKNITSDFILAKLNDNQKESIVELVRDAYFVQKEINKLQRGWRYQVKNGKYVRNVDGTFKKHELNNDERKYIENLGVITFNSYMVKIIMIVILYRNIDQNVLLELMTSKEKTEAETEQLQRENMALSEKVKSKLANQEGKEMR